MKSRMMLCAAVILSLCLALTGCADTPKQGEPAQDPAADASNPQVQTPPAVPAPTPPDVDPASIDVDLTALSGTMVYAEVYNMVMTPEDYIGKTVKMNGQFSVYQPILEDGSIDQNKIYYACVISNATACCAQGIEFVWSGEHSYPTDYPAIDSEITVTGQFQTYEEEGLLYCQLIDADLFV